MSLFSMPELVNTYHVHRFKSSKRSSRCVERAKAWINEAFDEMMVLFNLVVQILVLPQLHCLW